MLISTLTPQEVLLGTGWTREQVSPGDALTRLLAYVCFYDARGGGVETSFKGDKQGLGVTRRNKRGFAAQQMVVLLNGLAHNVVVWARRWLSAPGYSGSGVKRYGILRMVRDAFHISGYLVFDALGQVRQVVLNETAPLVRCLVAGLSELLWPEHVVVNLGKT